MTEQFIMEELPLARGFQYQHAILRSYDMETYYVKDDMELEENEDLFNSIINQPLDDLG